MQLFNYVSLFNFPIIPESVQSSLNCQYGSAFNTRWRYWRAKFVRQVLLAISARTSSNMWLATRQTRSTALPLLTIP